MRKDIVIMSPTVNRAVYEWKAFLSRWSTIIKKANRTMPYVPVNKIENAPPATPQPKIGHWINIDEKSAICSCCNRNNTLYGDFCKWCGAKNN